MERCDFSSIITTFRKYISDDRGMPISCLPSAHWKLTGPGSMRHRKNTSVSEWGRERL